MPGLGPDARSRSGPEARSGPGSDARSRPDARSGPGSPPTARLDAHPDAGGGLDGYLAAHQQAILEAHDRIAPHIRRTPTLTTDLDPDLLLKPECFQVTGSFKPRGAFNAVLLLRQREPGVRGVIAVSSGNHAQAVALAARTAGLEAVIVIPADANPAKVEATRRLGAEVVQEGVTFDNRERRMREIQAERRLALIHPFDDWDVIHGAATAVKELLEDVPAGEIEIVVAPVGGGGLLSGSALVAKATLGTRVIGVEPERADDAARTFRSGRIQTLAASPDTIADGVRVVRIGERNFEIMVTKRLIDDIVTVTEQEVEQALLTAWSRLKLALEPTGALPLAAYLAGKLGGAVGRHRRQDAGEHEGTGGGTGAGAEGGKIALILSGGNFNPQVVSGILAGTV
ncbi:MAG: threonine ammonia-lyase [Candidatus Dormibacteraceae bacterium]